MTTGLRERFWSEAKQILEGPLAGPEGFSQLERLLGQYGDGWDLVRSPAPVGCQDAPNAICRPLPESVVGYRSFLIDWELGAETATHGHPSVMFVYPISAVLEAVEYAMVDGRPEPLRTVRYGPGQSMTGWAPNDRHDNFVHRLRCVQPGWSLHIYSDYGGRGPRFDADGNRLVKP